MDNVALFFELDSRVKPENDVIKKVPENDGSVGESDREEIERVFESERMDSRVKPENGNV